MLGVGSLRFLHTSAPQPKMAKAAMTKAPVLIPVRADKQPFERHVCDESVLSQSRKKQPVPSG